METTTRTNSSRCGLGPVAIVLALAALLAGPARAQSVGSGDGLLGSYFDNRHLSGDPVTERVEPQVDFDWVMTARRA